MSNLETYLKRSRSGIVIAIKKRFPDEDYRQLLRDWGYDVRLSQINDPDLLREIHALASGSFGVQAGSSSSELSPNLHAGLDFKHSQLHQYPQPSLGTLDAQGKYAFALMHQAGWTVPRLRALIIKTAGTANWAKLTKAQQRQIINILKNYAKKPNKETS
jgi:hypothetical protein